MASVSPDLDAAFRLIAATAFGAALGWEREAHRKAAGLRTHMLVALGAATLIVLGTGLAETRAGTMDPIRVIQGVAAGIGFLGAGQILQSEDRVRGLTTAAGIWLVGAVGVACGMGHYLIAFTAVVLGLLTLSVVNWLEGRLLKRTPGGPQ